MTRTAEHPVATSTIGPACPLIALNVPQAGGTTLSMALVAAFGEAHRTLYGSDRHKGLHVLRDDDASVICGHFAYGVHRWMTRPACYVSIVREPVDRILETYLLTRAHRRRTLDFLRKVDASMEHVYAKWSRLEGVGRLLASHGKRPSDLGSYRAAKEWKQASFAERFELAGLPEYLADFMPWLESEDTLEGFLDCPSAELDNGMTRRFSGFGVAPEPCPPEALEEALRNIDAAFSMIGLYEELEASLRETGEMFGIEALGQDLDPHQRAGNPAAIEVPPALRDRIAEMNALDLELYSALRERFQRQRRDAARPRVVDPEGRNDLATIPLWKGVGGMQAVLRGSGCAMCGD